MWPASAAFTTALGASSRRWKVAVDISFGSDTLASLDVVTAGSVDVDDVAVRRTLSLTLVDADGVLTPSDARDLLAPRGTELTVRKGLQVAGGEYEWVPLGVFLVSSPEVTSSQGGTTISLRGYDRVHSVRVRRFDSPWRVAEGTPTHQAIADIVTSRLVVPTRITLSGHTTPELVFDELSDPWDAVRKLAASDGLTAYFDQLGSLVVAPDEEVDTGISYAPGPGSLLVSPTQRELDAEDTYSGVIVTGEHPDHPPVRSVLWDVDPSSPTYSDGPFGRRPFGFASPLIITQAMADAAAATIFDRVTHMRQKVRVRTVGHVGHDVGDVVTIVDPSTRTSGRYVVTGARVPLRTGEIELSLKEAVGG